MNKTDRLHLMKPVNSDPFTPADFDESFQTIDNYPGVWIAANNSSLPSGWDSTRDGMLCLQKDKNVLWQWDRPGSGAGNWRRVASQGVLGSSPGPNSKITVTSPPPDNGVVTMTVNATALGGRHLSFDAHLGSVNKEGDAQGIIWMALLYNNDIVKAGVVNSDPLNGTCLQMRHITASVPAANTAMKVTFNVKPLSGGKVIVNVDGAGTAGSALVISEV